MVRQFSQVAAALFFCACFLTPAWAASNLEEDLVRFLDWFEGEFDNHEQVWQQGEDGVPEEDRHEHIHHIFKRVAAPAIGEHTYFVRQYMDGDYENVYRQRLYNFTLDEKEGAIRLAIYTFADEAKYRDTDRDPSLIKEVTLEELTNRPGCDVFWDFRADHYHGYMKDKACFFFSERMGKNIYITDTLKLTEDEIWIGDKAFDEEGNKVFGRDEQHRNRKVRYFKGWAGMKYSAFDPDAEDPDETAFFGNLRLHNEGEILPLVTKDGRDTGYSIQLARLTYQNTRVAILKLGLIENASGKTVTYTWADPLGRRIGVNLRWMQMGLTDESLAE